jgi:hypothetical protein
VAAKKKPSNTRPYTGYDGTAGGTTAGLNVLIRTLERVTGKGLWNNGAWGVRDMKGKPGNPSVHATGRAVDMSWRNMPDDRGKPNWYQPACQIIETLIANANEIGLEMVIDYQPDRQANIFGRAWRCDRARWKNYDKQTVSGAPGGDWMHIEISPAMGRNPEGMKTALDKAFGLNTPQP